MTSGGIYKIENTVNNKVYIGQTKNFKNRWQHHKADLNRGDHKNIHLQSAWNKYGSDKFIFSIIEKCESNLNDCEIYWIDKLNARNREFGYNIAAGGNAPTLGRHLSAETREKISLAHKGQPSPMRGIPMSEKAKKHMSVAAILRCQRVKPVGMIGKHHTEETKKKISMNHVRRKTSRNTSGYIGVNFDKTRNKWLVRININGKPKNIGRYEDLIFAAGVYDKACWDLHHDLSLLNFPAEYTSTTHSIAS